MARTHMTIEWFTNIPWLLVGAAILLGAILVGWLGRKIIVGCVSCLKPSVTTIMDPKTKLSRRVYKRQPIRNVIYLLAICFQITVVGLGVLVAFSVAGVNLFSLAFSVGIVTMVVGYASQPIILNTLCSVIVLSTDKIEVGDEVHLPAINVRGTISDMRNLYTIIDQEGTGHVMVPNTHFVTSVVVVEKDRSVPIILRRK